ncbi:hypothetical protein AOLI_G00316980 [Acnodon oligacanthus]
MSNLLRSPEDTVEAMDDILVWDTPQPASIHLSKDNAFLSPSLGRWREDRVQPVVFCSRTLTWEEQRYSQIGKECLAAVWACESLACFLHGLSEFTLQIDHKALVPLINMCDLDKAPLQCEQQLMRLMCFNLRAMHVPGKLLVVADTLSHNPVDNITSSDTEANLKAYVEALVSTRLVSEPKVQVINSY